MVRVYRQLPREPGLTRNDVTPKSLPGRPPMSHAALRGLPDHLGQVEQRLGADGTNWCLGCDTTILARHDALLCPVHRVARSSQRRAANRASKRTHAAPDAPIHQSATQPESTDATTASAQRATSRTTTPRPPDAGLVLTHEQTVEIRAAVIETNDKYARNEAAQAGDSDDDPFATNEALLEQLHRLISALRPVLRPNAPAGP